VVNTPAPPPVPDELAAVLRRMRLPYVRAAAPEVLATARAQRWDPAEVLRVLLAEEAAGRDQATRRMRRRTAALPTEDVRLMEVRRLLHPGTHPGGAADLEWIGRAENLAGSGPSGTGDDHRAGTCIT
jgi:DNA replication protein DnaC